MAKVEVSYEEIIKEVRARIFRPVYYLMGEEPYYIDRIADFIASNVLSETEREFNQVVLYGQDTDMPSVVTFAKRYPMMADHQVLIVKEAQNLKNAEELSFYLKNPQPSTILVFCHKNGVLDRRKKLASEIEKVGLLYESKKLKDGQLPSFITGYLKRKEVTIDTKAAMMLADFIGADLSRMVGELDKLIISKPQNTNCITPEMVEQNVGISKDYNLFELRNALAVKDIYKANVIIKYFEENPKNNPVQMVLAMLFNFYSNLMLAYYAPTKSEEGVAAYLDFRGPWQARDYLTAMRYYNAFKVMSIISDIRQYDAMSKGVGTTGSFIENGFLRELVFKILH